MTRRMAFTLGLCILFSQGVALSQSTSTTKQQKITMAAARKIALGSEAGIVKSGEREIEKGKLIYSFDIQMPNGTHEVNGRLQRTSFRRFHREPGGRGKRKGPGKEALTGFSRIAASPRDGFVHSGEDPVEVNSCVF